MEERLSAPSGAADPTTGIPDDIPLGLGILNPYKGHEASSNANPIQEPHQPIGTPDRHGYRCAFLRKPNPEAKSGSQIRL